MKKEAIKIYNSIKEISLIEKPSAAGGLLDAIELAYSLSRAGGRKQYYSYESCWPYIKVELYLDGELCVTCKVTDYDEIYYFTEFLEAIGFTQGYLKEELERAQKELDEMKNNLIF